MERVKPKILSFAVLALIIAAVPLTVFIAQKQQEIRQRADEGNPLQRGVKPFCPTNVNPNFTCREESCEGDEIDNSATYNCGYLSKCCYRYVPPVVTSTPPIIVRPSVTVTSTPMLTVTSTPAISPSPSPSVTASPQPTGSIAPTVTITASPTISSTPPDGDGQTVLDVELSFMAIGNDTSRAVNNNPKTRKPDVLLEIFTPIGKEPIATKTAQLTYDSDTGTFKGTYNLEDVVKRTREYSFRVKTNKYLGKLLGKDTDQIVKTIVKGSRNSAPKTSLIVGDVNNDNRVDIADANIFFACWNKTINTPVPLEGISAKCDITDLDDDWVLHPKSKDYGWFMESIGLVEGD